MATSFNHWGEIANNLRPALKRVVRKTAKEIAAGAAIFAPVDTGFLQASIYVQTSTSSTYGKGGHVNMTPYQALHHDLLPETDPPTDDLTAHVAVGASYGIYVEYGTRFMPAQPFFEPAVALAQPVFDAELKLIEPSLLGSISVEEI